MGRSIRDRHPELCSLAMNATETDLAGVWHIRLEKNEDERGHFSRIYCPEAFSDLGLAFPKGQWSISHNRRKGTLRGLHYRDSAHAETKLVRCVRGAIWDVAVDCRSDSPTFGRHIAFELEPDNGDALYLPPGIAHGHQSLRDDTDVLYMISLAYTPGGELGIRWDDPTLSISWPMAPTVISAADAALPFWRGK